MSKYYYLSLRSSSSYFRRKLLYTSMLTLVDALNKSKNENKNEPRIT